MRERVEHVPRALPPVTKNKDLQVRANAVVLKNAGSSIITLDDHWTLRPGESLPFGDSSGPEGVVTLNWKIRFSETGTRRLEVCAIYPKGELSTANYVDQP